MNGLVLTLTDEPAFDIDVSEIIPENLAGLSLDKIRRMRLQHGKQRLALGDILEVSGTYDGTVSFVQSSAKLRRIGNSMSSGTVFVSGTAGDELGGSMTGGEIHLKGDARDYVGSNMRGGIINISGRAGNFAGGASPRNSMGMRDGVICIRKSAGDRAGDRMRRGLLLVHGDIGEYSGSNMIAGTLVVGGRAAAGVGFGMRRGTIVLLNEPASIPTTFNDCGTYSLATLTLLTRYVKTVDTKMHSRMRVLDLVRRFAGDIGANGQGELLVNTS